MKKKFNDNYMYTDHEICIELPIESDEYISSFVLKNARMRNIIRNDFVEEANKYKGEYNMYYDFNVSKFKTEYYNSIEKPIDRYGEYATGISEQVAEDIFSAIQTIRAKNAKEFERAKENHIDFKDIILGEFHFKKFDINRYCFRVKVKNDYRDSSLRLRLKVIDKKYLQFIVRGKYHGHKEESMYIKLKSKLYNDLIYTEDSFLPTYIRYYKSNGNYHCMRFSELDITSVCFKYELGKHYILLFLKPNFVVNKDSIGTKIAGIDTGIRHPITIYDGKDKDVKYIRFDDRVSTKIHKLDRRIARLQKYRSYKYDYNKAHGLNTDSKNIRKLDYKIRKLYKRISNIKHHQLKIFAKALVTRYGKIVVDDCTWPNANETGDFPKKVARYINYVSKFHNISFFNDYLKYAALKYGCEYISAPEDTTRTCSKCGYINDHLKLSDKYLRCANCDSVIERDLNASKNCYNYAFV